LALATSTRIGASEILTLLGSGSMGEVYRASDTKLDRVVDGAMRTYIVDLNVGDRPSISVVDDAASTCSANTATRAIVLGEVRFAIEDVTDDGGSRVG
jgi:hypothetical protein